MRACGSNLRVIVGSLGHVSSAYATMSEVHPAGLRAMDREDAAPDAVRKARVEEALRDPRPSAPLDEAFAGLRAYAAAQRGA
jgi:antitoxin ParD1/3/4